MKWLVIAVLIMAQQPAKAPESRGAAESNSAQSTAHARGTSSKQATSTQATPIPAQTPVTTESQRSGATAKDHTATASQQSSNEDRATQRKLTWFTGVLASVGVLQLVVMFLTWLVYRRQAREMRRQRHEMRQQRHIMWRQWKAMGEQATLVKGQLEEMQSAGKQTDALIEQAKKQVGELHDTAEAALLSAEGLTNSERAWIMVEVVGPVQRSDGTRRARIVETASFKATGTHMDVEVLYKNEGRSPCWITNTWLEFRIVKSIPEQPDFSSTIPTNEGKGAISVGRATDITWSPTSEGRINEDTRAIAYGLIEYLDIFRAKRTTTFGYEVESDGRLERLIDHPGYNKNT
jgi:hypothetical protein